MPDEPSEQWKKEARHFAAYMLVLHRPWTHKTGSLPASLNWYEFCLYMDKLEFGKDRKGASRLDTVRRQWIEHMSQGFRINADQRSINQMYRMRAATIWEDPERADEQNQIEREFDNIDEDIAKEAAEIIENMREDQLISDQILLREAKQQEDVNKTIQTISNLTASIEKVQKKVIHHDEASKIIHIPMNQPDGSPSIPMILELLTSDNDQEEVKEVESNDTNYQEDPSIPCPKEDDHSKGLNKQQKVVFDSYAEYFLQLDEYRKVYFIESQVNIHNK